MSKSYNQKMKIIYIMKLLQERTDEEHPVSTKEIIEYLETKEIRAERKSIYDDIATLTQFGMDIERTTGKDSGYYLADRTFELPELKLLVDAVQSSKFITQKKSRELIKKLETLASVSQAKLLNRQVVVCDRNKALNESIYYNIDMIYTGIAENSKIRFQYYEWDISKEMKLKKQGEFYEVSPWYLNWDDENYYLIAYDDKVQLVKHFRVDKMLKIGLMDEKRLGREQMEDLNLARYTKKTFGMFSGTEQTVSIECDNALIGVVIDRFGQEIAVRKINENCFRARTDVAVSPQFFGWLAGLGNRVKIVAPEMVKKEYQEYLEKILDRYQEE